MYYLLSLLTGILISVMVAFNGGLTERYGVYSAAIIIHITGLMLIAAVSLVKRDKLFANRQAWYLYTGGAIGALTTVFNNMAFGRISVSAILALGLFGQSLTGILIDWRGLMGMPRRPLGKKKIIGLVIIFCGIVSMINNFEALAVSVSFWAGVCIVISRTINAKLAELTNVRVSTFYNYFIGFIIVVALCLLLGGGETGLANLTLSKNALIYLGGITGVFVVLFSNMTVAKISALYLTLLIFIGQVFSGILIDAVISNEFSTHNLIGGVLVAAGLCVNLYLDRTAATAPRDL